MRPKLLFAFNEKIRNQYLPPLELQRLEAFADWDWFPCKGGGIYDANDDPVASSALSERVKDVDGIVVCHGAPTLSARVLDMAPNLRFVGELESDRFATRIALEAAWARGIRVVDTTNGSSYPVAEWALGLILIATRNAGAHFRRLIVRDTKTEKSIVRSSPGMLAGKRVGFIGCGHMGRHLLKLLSPFGVDVWVYDPYLPREMAEALGFLQTSLDNVMGKCDVLVCMAPHTHSTEGMIGEAQIAMMRSGTVFVNVSRGAIVDSDALVARIKQGDIFVGLDVFNPEPIPPKSELLKLPNVFLSPHIGWFNGREYPTFFSLMVDELDRFFHGHETWYDLTPLSQANRRGEVVR